MFLRGQLVYCTWWMASDWLYSSELCSWQWRQRCYNSTCQQYVSTTVNTCVWSHSHTWQNKTATAANDMPSRSHTVKECTVLVLPARWVRGTNSGASTFKVVGIGHFSGKYFVRIIVRSGEISTPELSLIAWNQQTQNNTTTDLGFK